MDFLKACVNASVLLISNEKISLPAIAVNGVSGPNDWDMPGIERDTAQMRNLRVDVAIHYAHDIQLALKTVYILAATQTGHNFLTPCRSLAEFRVFKGFSWQWKSSNYIRRSNTNFAGINCLR